MLKRRNFFEMHKQCLQCSKLFYAKKSWINFCSEHCRRKSRWIKKKICVRCGSLFIPQDSRHNHCSINCANSTRATTHGESKSRLYNIWHCMIQRCHGENNHDFKYYGGRGITVCDEWKNDYTVFRDWALTHGYTDDLEIERKNNYLGYSPDNCCWVTDAEQQHNRRDNVGVWKK